MRHEDDPEARIRELERPLSEQARASELTTPGNWDPSSYVSPVTPAAVRAPRPPSFPPRFTPKTSRNLSLILALAGVAVPAAAAFVFFAGDFTRAHQLPPSTPSTGHPTSIPFQIQPGGSMVVDGTTIAVGPAPVQPAEPPEQPDRLGLPIRITGIGSTRTAECHDNGVQISGASNTITLTGSCNSVVISGIENTVVLDSARQIVMSGIGNRVTYHSGTPEIIGANSSNTIAQG